MIVCNMLPVLLLTLISLCHGFYNTIPNARIVGGEKTTISKYPYQLSLLLNDKHICGAALVKPRWAITAAHCTDGSRRRDLSVLAGSTNKSYGGKQIGVAKVFQHDNYNASTLDYDISILKLQFAIPQKFASTIPLGDCEDITENGMASVTGWGTNCEGGISSETLQVVKVPIVSRSECCRIYTRQKITCNMFCAGYIQGGKDTCQGDSGGPLVINGQLVGIVSWGYGCARPGYPGVYTKIPALKTFISNVIDE